MKIKDYLLPYWKICLVVLLAIAVRGVYLYQLNLTPYFENINLDQLHYDQTALRILDGDYLLGPEVLDMGPLYSFFLALIYSVFGHHLLAVRLIQILIGSLSCLLVYAIGSRLFDERRALLAAVLAALYAPFVFLEGNLESESLAIVLNLASIYLLARSLGGRTALFLFLAGVCMGLSAVVRPNVILFVPLALFWIGLVATPGAIFRNAALFLLGCFLIISPVTVRNYVVAGDAVLITSSGGFNFFLGNNAEASGTITPPDFIRFNPQTEHKDAKREAERRAGRPLKASEASSFWFREGLGYIASAPAAYLELLGKKLFYVASFYEIPDNMDFQLMKKIAPVLGFPMIGFGVIFPFFMLGLLASIREWRRYLLLHLMIGSYLVFFLMFFVTSRYRIPVLPFMLIFSAHGIFLLVEYFRQKNITRVVLATALLVAGALVSNMDIGRRGKVFEAHAHNSLGTVYYSAGDVDRALREYEAAYAILPFDDTINNNLAYTYAKKGVRLDTALGLALGVAQRKPGDAVVLGTLSYIYYRLGDLERAKEALILAARSEPDNAEIQRNLAGLAEGKYPE